MPRENKWDNHGEQLGFPLSWHGMPIDILISHVLAIWEPYLWCMGDPILGMGCYCDWLGTTWSVWSPQLNEVGMPMKHNWDGHWVQLGCPLSAIGRAVECSWAAHWVQLGWPFFTIGLPIACNWDDHSLQLCVLGRVRQLHSGTIHNGFVGWVSWQTWIYLEHSCGILFKKYIHLEDTGGTYVS